MATNKTFDIRKFLATRPLSWSALSSFEYDKEQWFETYILGKRQESPEMTFGSIVDKKIQTDPSFLPKLPRYPLMQYKMNAVFNGIPLTGLPDGLSLNSVETENTKGYKVFWDKGYILSDYKTGRKAWDKKRADETGQLTMYLFLLYILHKEKPEQFRCFIHWLPTVKHEAGDFTVKVDFHDGIHGEDGIKTIETKRTMADLLKFGERINKVIKEMEQYVRNHE
jgi:hypothetical protein